MRRRKAIYDIKLPSETRGSRSNPGSWINEWHYENMQYAVIFKSVENEMFQWKIFIFFFLFLFKTLIVGTL